MRVTLGLLAVVLSTLTASACSTGPIPEAVTPVTGVTQVRVQSNYAPPVIEVTAGTAVTWVFDDGNTQHDVTGVGWGSDKLTNTTWTYTFATPGRFDYLCSLHPDMKGRVVVVSR